MGIGSIVLGIVSVVVGLFHITDIVRQWTLWAFILAFSGIVLGWISLKKSENKKIAIIGLVLCGIGITVFCGREIYWWFMLVL